MNRYTDATQINELDRHISCMNVWPNDERHLTLLFVLVTDDKRPLDDCRSLLDFLARYLELKLKCSDKSKEQRFHSETFRQVTSLYGEREIDALY